MRWLWHLVRMPSGRLLGEVFSGMSHRQEAPLMTWDVLRLSAGVGTLWKSWMKWLGKGRSDESIMIILII